MNSFLFFSSSCCSSIPLQARSSPVEQSRGWGRTQATLSQYGLLKLEPKTKSGAIKWKHIQKGSQDCSCKQSQLMKGLSPSFVFVFYSSIQSFYLYSFSFSSGFPSSVVMLLKLSLLFLSCELFMCSASGFITQGKPYRLRAKTSILHIIWYTILSADYSKTINHNSKLGIMCTFPQKYTRIPH